MQTFLPYPSFAESARVLDRQRLGKQRVECLQILNALTGRSTAWRNHPATKMWAGYEIALALYALRVCDEWILRGYKDTCYQKILNLNVDGDSVMPPWLTEEFCSSHRAALLFKNPEWYGQFGWTEKPELNYIWPVT